MVNNTKLEKMIKSSQNVNLPTPFGYNTYKDKTQLTPIFNLSEPEYRIDDGFNFSKNKTKLSDIYHLNSDGSINYGYGIKTPNEKLFPQEEINKGNIGYNLWKTDNNNIYDGIDPRDGLKKYSNPNTYDPIGDNKYGLLKVIEKNITNGLNFSTGNDRCIKDKNEFSTRKDIQHKLSSYGISSGTIDYRELTKEFIEETMNEECFSNEEKYKILSPLVN